MNKPRRRKCRWEKDQNGNYITACGEVFVFIADGVSENGFNYCPYCGHEIQEPKNEQATTD